MVSWWLTAQVANSVQIAEHVLLLSGRTSIELGSENSTQTNTVDTQIFCMIQWVLHSDNSFLYEEQIRKPTEEMKKIHG